MVCLDEISKQLVKKLEFHFEPGPPQYYDYEYEHVVYVTYLCYLNL